MNQSITVIALQVRCRCCLSNINVLKSKSLEKLASSLEIKQISGSEPDKKDLEPELEAVKSPLFTSMASSTGRQAKELLLLIASVLFFLVHNENSVGSVRADHHQCGCLQLR